MLRVLPSDSGHLDRLEYEYVDSESCNVLSSLHGCIPSIDNCLH